MSPDLTLFIANYGYLAIFILIFLQEIGIPNPIPNELVLAYSGYLCSVGVFQIPLVVLTAVSADFIGTNILYIVFYFFGEFILKHKPRWIPISQKGIDKAAHRVTNGGMWAIYVGRITPFIRGYTSVIAGLLHIPPKTFLPIVLISALTWSIAGVLFGRLMGQYWNHLAGYMADLKYILLPILLLICVYFLFKFFQKRLKIKAEK